MKINFKKAGKELLGKTFETELIECSPNISAAIPFALPGVDLLLRYYLSNIMIAQGRNYKVSSKECCEGIESDMKMT